MSFLKKIGKALGKGIQKVGKAVGKAAQSIAPIAAIIPGIGNTLSAGLGLIGGVLGPKGKGGGSSFIGPTIPAQQLQPKGGSLMLPLLGLAALFLLK